MQIITLFIALALSFGPLLLQANADISIDQLEAQHSQDDVHGIHDAGLELQLGQLYLQRGKATHSISDLSKAEMFMSKSAARGNEEAKREYEILRMESSQPPPRRLQVRPPMHPDQNPIANGLFSIFGTWGLLPILLFNPATISGLIISLIISFLIGLAFLRKKVPVLLSALVCSLISAVLTVVLTFIMISILKLQADAAVFFILGPTIIFGAILFILLIPIYALLFRHYAGKGETSRPIKDKGL